MDNKSYDQLLTMKATIESNSQYYDEKMKKLTEDLTPMIASMMDQMKIPKSSSENKDSPKDQNTTTVVLANKKAPPFKDGYSKRIGGMWTLKHEISLPKLCELLIKKDIKCCTAMDLKRFYNHIIMCLN